MMEILTHVQGIIPEFKNSIAFKNCSDVSIIFGFRVGAHTNLLYLARALSPSCCECWLLLAHSYPYLLRKLP